MQHVSRLAWEGEGTEERRSAVKGTHREGAAPPSPRCPTPPPPGAATHRSGSADADTTACGIVCVSVEGERRKARRHVRGELHRGGECLGGRTAGCAAACLSVARCMNCRRARREETAVCVRAAWRRASEAGSTHLHGQQPAGQALLLGRVAGLLLRHGWECSPVPRLLSGPPTTRALGVDRRTCSESSRRVGGGGRQVKGRPAAASAAAVQQDDKRVECAAQTVNRKGGRRANVAVSRHAHVHTERLLLH